VKYQVRPHPNAWRVPGYGWETVLEVLTLKGPMVDDSAIFDVADIDPAGESMVKQWTNGELPGPIFADWIEDHVTDHTHYALPRLLAALRAER